LVALLIAIPAAARAQDKPFAFVRSLAVTPVVSLVREAPPPAPLPAKLAADKKRKAQWEAGAARHAAARALTRAAPFLLAEKLTEQLDAVPGLALVEARESPAWTRAGKGSLPQPDLDSLSAAARSAGTDAAATVAVDRFGTEDGLERGIWLRARAFVRSADGSRSHGPIVAVGWARSGRSLFGKGYRNTDEELLDRAVTQLATRLLRSLRTGVASPFHDSGTVAVLPAAVPERVLARGPAAGPDGQNAETVAVEVPSLQRSADVLFHPELDPTIPVADLRSVRGGMEKLGIPPLDLWAGSREIDEPRVVRVAQALSVRLLFLSRVDAVDFQQSPVTVRSQGAERAGVERRVDVRVRGVLYDARDRRILWTDVAEGGTIAHTEFVRGEPRLRSEEQTVLDAARTAYAHLRAAFDDFRKRFE
jgi:hypothetical protein